MFPYWLLFGVVAWMAIYRIQATYSNASLHNHWPLAWVICLWVLTSAIGLRHEVGADWNVYLDIFDMEIGSTLGEYLSTSMDPAYALISWFGGNIWGSIYIVNFFCGLFFSWGLIVFCRAQPLPWLALLVAVPYLITVVAMGYSRQGAAIGVAMLAITTLLRGSLWGFLFWISLAMTFHKSAIVLVPFALFAINRNYFISIISVLSAAPILFLLMLQESLPFLIIGYIESEYESSGAAFRIGMNSVPALLFLTYRKRFSLNDTEKNFWTIMSFSGLFFVGLLFAFRASVALDRLALYWIPLQLFFWSRLPYAMASSLVTRRLCVGIVIAYTFLVYYVWLNFSIHSEYWIPYQFYPWQLLWN